MQVEAHGRKVPQRPGRRRGEARDGAGVHQPGLAALDVRHLLDAGYMRMPAAHKVPAPGARHGVAILGIVHCEDFASPISSRASGPWYCNCPLLSRAHRESETGSPRLLPWITCIGRPTAIAARRVCVPMRSPQWMTAFAPCAAASRTAAASGSARSWLSETMQIFMRAS